MRLNMSAAAWLFVLIGFAASAWAQDPVTGNGIEVHATFHHVGVMLDITGDANNNAAADLDINIAGQGFEPAHRLSRSGRDRFIGTAFGLDPGTPFEIRVTLRDPDGARGGPFTASGVTRSLSVPEATGRVWHVSPSGADNNDGSAQSPFEHIAAGFAAAQAGDEILVHAGIYHESIEAPRAGREGAPIVLRGEPGAILDGANPALKVASAWTSEGGGLYSAPSGQTFNVAVDGVRLWHYGSLAALRNLNQDTDGGFFSNGNRVTVRLPGDAAPQGHTIQVSALPRALWLAGSAHVVIRDLTFRHYGSEQFSQGIMVRDGAHKVWITGNTFENIQPGIWIKNRVDDLTIQHNSFSDVGTTGFGWHAVKAQGQLEGGALYLDNSTDTQGIVFLSNTVHDFFDGLHLCGAQATDHPSNTDVIGNHFTRISDDAIEADGTCTNIRILGNRIEEALVGISTAPSSPGPAYIVRNLLLELQNVAPTSEWSPRALKTNSSRGSSGELFVYHNTAMTEEAGQSTWTVNPGSHWSALHLRNNIWVGEDRAFYHDSDGDPMTQDHDLIASARRLVFHDATDYSSTQAYFNATGHCEHCLAGAPGFRDAPRGDFALTPQSLALDRGTPLPGINHGFSGTGPDLGALELVEDPPDMPDAGPPVEDTGPGVQDAAPEDTPRNEDVPTPREDVSVAEDTPDPVEDTPNPVEDAPDPAEDTSEGQPDDTNDDPDGVDQAPDPNPDPPRGGTLDSTCACQTPGGKQSLPAWWVLGLVLIVGGRASMRVGCLTRR